MEENEDAYIDYMRLIKRGYSAQNAAEITGYVPEKAAAPKPTRTFSSYTGRGKSKWYFNVPFADKDAAKQAAKEAGTMLFWDPKAENPETKKMGCWYVEVQTFGNIYDPFSLRKWQFKYRNL